MENYKEVLFEKYCSMCNYYLIDGYDEPCNTCLSYPCRQYSHTPLCYEMIDNAKKK